MQYASQEKKILEVFIAVCCIIFSVYAIKSLKEICTLKFIVVAGLFAKILSVLDMSYAHFGQDVLYFCGNILHHADISAYRDESNATFVAMTPQGFALSTIFTILWGFAIRAVIVQYIPKLNTFMSASAVNIASMLGLLFIFNRVKYAHPQMHSIATADMKDSHPLSFEWMAYQHVFVHHGNGDSFGPSVWTDWLFSSFLY
eukprot:CAMPEP_0170127148 /NCGR_PEP_ID=MMETSP0020_2-20130122/20227_1 /TAXON_ID=98059 /ORGANISM="Dinobryon sp., Strain UTEXLB2267" /LENGTH=200 /DNA_ID=CAMNT_0010360471 /DNA_START=168 /DNA_END=767 /DNA_ORIENTATION=+